MKRPRVLVIDDDPAIRETAALALEKSGFEVRRAADLDSARSELEDGRFDAVLSDIYLPGETALPLLQEIRRDHPSTAVVLMTARGSIETATLASRAGAFDYVAKPFDVGHLVQRVRAAIAPPEEQGVVVEPPVDSMIIGSHPAMVEVYKAMARVAPMRVPVLILGETGTGKELVARALHDLSPSASAPFVAVNCGAIPDTLLESELFGHVRGAFTDARRDRRGALARAHGGTVFLDEIGDISPAFQVKILRFLQDGVVTPLGADRGEKVDVRVVAATNRDIRELMNAGAFRQDLFFRLAAYEIVLPPLRERASDIVLLVEHFRKKVGRELALPAVGPPSTAVVDVLLQHRWPGNVRELEQVVRRMLIDAGSLTDPETAERVIGEIGRVVTVRMTTKESAVAVEAMQPSLSPLSTLEEAERRHILTVLSATGGNRTRAAEILGIERKTLGRKLRRYAIDESDDAGT